MEIRRFELPMQRRRPRRKSDLFIVLEAIQAVRREWCASTDEPIWRELPEGGQRKTSPVFRAMVGERLELLRDEERRRVLPPAPLVEEVLDIGRHVEDGRAVRRAVVRWSDGTVGEALAWFEGTLDIVEDDFIGLDYDHVDVLLARRSL